LGHVAVGSIGDVVFPRFLSIDPIIINNHEG
jgi:hypothetical protein